MATESKKGACSAHVTDAKANCLQHNRRDVVPSYVNPHLTHHNRTVYEDEVLHGRKSIIPLKRQAERLYTEKTGQKCQKSFAPFREDVLVVKEGITDEQLMNYKKSVEALTGWRVVGIWLHQDEGHYHSKYVEGDEDFAINYHAHVLYDCQDHVTGKAIRCHKDFMRKRQDLLAEATGMERGNPASETGRRHRSSMQQRIIAQEERIATLEATQATLEAQGVGSTIRDIFSSSTAKKKDERIAMLEAKLQAEKKRAAIAADERYRQGRKEGYQNAWGQARENYHERLESLTRKQEQADQRERQAAERESNVARIVEDATAPLRSQIEAMKKEMPARIQSARQEERRNTIREIKDVAGLHVGNDNNETAAVIGRAWKRSFDINKESRKKEERLTGDLSTATEKLKNLKDRIIRWLQNGVDAIVDRCYTDGQKHFSETQASIIHATLGNEEREDKAEMMIEIAEERLSDLAFSNYTIHRLYHFAAPDVRDIAAGHEISVVRDRGRSL